MDYSGYQFLEITVEDGVAVVAINRPDKLGATTAKGHTEMTWVFRDLTLDEDVRAVVLTGKGRAFSVGPDLEGWADAKPLHGITEETDLVYNSILFRKPVVAAINGPIFGSAMTWAMLADIVVCERHVKLSDPHIDAGLVAGDGMQIVYPLYMGLLRAKRYMMTGDPIPAEEAHRIGLVSEVVDKGESLAKAMEFARRFADGPQIALQFTKWALNQWLRQAALTAFDTGIALEGVSTLVPGGRDAYNRINSKGSRGQGVMRPDETRVASDEI